MPAPKATTAGQPCATCGSPIIGRRRDAIYCRAGCNAAHRPRRPQLPPLELLPWEPPVVQPSPRRPHRRVRPKPEPMPQPAVPGGLTVSVLRELFRNLVEFRAAYETDGVDTITGPDGERYSLWDVERLWNRRLVCTPRQRQTLELCLLADLTEPDAALLMGARADNPVGMYSTNGLRRILS